MKWLLEILDILFPPACVGCGKGRKFLCVACVENATPAEDSYDENIFAVFNYHDRAIRRAIWRLKYKGTREIAQALGRALADQLKEIISEQDLYYGFGEPTVIPVPLSPARSRARGYNQAELLAQEVGLPILSDVLIKIKDTPTQVSKKVRQERLKNLEGAFQISDPEKIKDKNIILIDDVTTTGATFSECSRVLKSAGARRVISLALAH